MLRGGAVLPLLALALAEELQQALLLVGAVPAQYPNEGVAELRVVEGVQERVDGGVEVAEPQREQVDVHVEGTAQERLEGEEHEVRHPAHGERQHDGGERHHRLRVARRHLLFVVHVTAAPTVAVAVAAAVVAVEHGALHAGADARHLVDLLHLLARDAQDPEVDDAHDDERTEVRADGDEQHVRLVEQEGAHARRRVAVLYVQVGRVPAEVDRHEAHDDGEGPDAGDRHPHDARRHLALVLQRPRQRAVAVDADGEQRQDGDGAQRDVRRREDVAEDAAERPLVVQRVDGAERQHAQADAQVGGGQRQDEQVRRRVHASVRQHRDGDEQIAEDRDEYDDAEDDPDDDD